MEDVQEETNVSVFIPVKQRKQLLQDSDLSSFNYCVFYLVVGIVNLVVGICLLHF